MARKGGRPTKLTAELRKVILDTIATGVPRSHAAKRAGITRVTLWGWLKRGRKDKKGGFSAGRGPAAASESTQPPPHCSLAMVKKSLCGFLVGLAVV
jgi:transposase-like protein